MGNSTNFDQDLSELRKRKQELYDLVVQVVVNDHTCMEFGKKFLDKWGIHEILAHFIEWDKETLKTIKCLLGRKEPIWIYNENAFNRRAVKKWGCANIHVLLETFKYESKKLLQAYTDLPVELREKHFFKDPQEDDTVAYQIAEDLRHHIEHIGQIKRAFKIE